MQSCALCSCECEGIAQEWSEGLDRVYRGGVAGIEGDFYALSGSPPVVTHFSASGMRTDLAGPELGWLEGAQSVALGVAADGTIVFFGSVSGQADQDVHVERYGPSGELLFMQTLHVAGADEVLALASLDSGDMRVLGRYNGTDFGLFAGTLSADNAWSVMLAAGERSDHIDALAAGAGRFAMLLTLPDSYDAELRTYGFDGMRLGAISPVTYTGNPTCALAFDRSEHLYRACVQSYPAGPCPITLRLDQFRADLAPGWRMSLELQSTYCADGAQPLVIGYSVGAVGLRDGLLVSATVADEYVLLRFNRLGEQVDALKPFYRPISVQAGSDESVYVIQRWGQSDAIVERYRVPALEEGGAADDQDGG